MDGGSTKSSRMGCSDLVMRRSNRICLLAADGRQIKIDQRDSTIVPRMADKSVELIKHARHEWPIKQPRDYQPWKDEK